MTTPKNERQEWRDFAHTVDVLTSSALATSDLAQAPLPSTKAAASGNRLGGVVRSSFAKRRAIAGALVAACLLLIAVPVARLLDLGGPGAGDPTRQPGNGTRPIALRIELAKSSYQPGEPLAFKLQSNKDCHPLVYAIGADNEVRLFDPTSATAVSGAAGLKADDPMQIPAPGGQGPAITPSSPGSYTIGALCSSETLSALGTSLGALREKAQEGRSSFESYLSGLADRDQKLAVARTTYEVK